MTADERQRKRLIGRLAEGASDRVLEVVDPDVILSHVDVNALLERVDVNELLDRVDVNRLLERVDVDRLMDRVDVPALVDRAGIPEIVAESTSHLTGSALDLFRRPLVGLDEIVVRSLNRLFRRDIDEYPEGPHDLMEWVTDQQGDAPQVKTGRFAGPVTRLLAVMLDAFVVTASFTAIVAGIWFAVGLFVDDVAFSVSYGVVYVVSMALYAFIYLWVSYAVFGKTIGKMVLGLRVVSSTGSPTLHGRNAFWRVLSYPLSFLVFGIGMLGVVFNPSRQAWHDRIAKTVVVYDWGSRTAAMPTPLAEFLERRGV